MCIPCLTGKEVSDRLADFGPTSIEKRLKDFIATCFNVLTHVRSAMAESQDKKEQVGVKDRGCIENNDVGDQVLLIA